VSFTILAAADLHLGRRPGGVPPELARRYGPRQALKRLVDAALRHRVDAVLLAGDLVDRRNASHEAWGPLDAALHRLREAAIPVVAVAGNHDAQALPVIARELGDGHLTLLGRGGRWERWTHPGDGDGPALSIDGWSFPEERHPADPTAGWVPDPAPPGPLLGLLHADLDAGLGPYAPVAASRLRALPHTAWVLGHIHAPALHRGAGLTPLLYPGSPQGLDPGEPGPHGAWLLTFRGGVLADATRLPLAGLRYDTVEVTLTGDDDTDDTQERIRGALVRAVRAAAEEEPDLGGLHLRLHLTGHSGHLARLPSLVREMEDFDPGGAHGLTTVLDTVPRIEANPARELAELAGADTAVGLLARLLLDLRDPGAAGAVEELVEQVRTEVAGVDGQAHLQEAGLVDGIDESTAEALLAVAAGRLLDTLLRQHGET
jgi:DNA repair exonuclease SbcCD nuclease subunit